MDIDSITRRVKDSQSDTKVIDIQGRRIYPNDVVIYPRQNSRGVEIGIVEKMTPTGLKILGDGRVFTSGELLVLPDNEDGIDGIIQEQRKILADSNSKPKAKKVLNIYRDFVVLKKDLKTGEIWLTKSYFSYLTSQTKDGIKDSMHKYLEPDKFKYMFLCKSKAGLYFSETIDDNLLKKPSIDIDDFRYIPRDELTGRPFDLHMLKRNLVYHPVNAVTYGQAWKEAEMKKAGKLPEADYEVTIDEDFVFEKVKTHHYYNDNRQERKLVYPLIPKVAPGKTSVNIVSEYNDYGMPIWGIAVAAYGDMVRDEDRYKAYEQELVELIKKGINEI